MAGVDRRRRDRAVNVESIGASHDEIGLYDSVDVIGADGSGSPDIKSVGKDQVQKDINRFLPASSLLTEYTPLNIRERRRLHYHVIAEAR